MSRKRKFATVKKKEQYLFFKKVLEKYREGLKDKANFKVLGEKEAVSFIENTKAKYAEWERRVLEKGKVCFVCGKIREKMVAYLNRFHSEINRRNRFQVKRGVVLCEICRELYFNAVKPIERCPKRLRLFRDYLLAERKSDVAKMKISGSREPKKIITEKGRNSV